MAAPCIDRPRRGLPPAAGGRNAVVPRWDGPCYIAPVRTSTSLPDHVLQEIDLFARRLRRSRTTLWADAFAAGLRRAGRAIVDALDGAVRGSVILPPP